MFRPSGDQSGWRSVSGLVVRRRTPVPSAFVLKRSNSLACGSVRVLENAIRPLKLSGADADEDEDEAAAPDAGAASSSPTAAQQSRALMSTRHGRGGLPSPSSASNHNRARKPPAATAPRARGPVTAGALEA